MKEKADEYARYRMQSILSYGSRAED